MLGVLSGRIEPRSSAFLAGDSRLLIDYAARSVYVDGTEVALTPTEFDVLACLAQRAGTVVSTPELIQTVWGEWFGPVDHVFVHVHHIRRKLGPCGQLIVTKRKAGYLLRGEQGDALPDTPWSQITREYSELLQEDARSRSSTWLLVDQERRVTWVSDSVTGLLGWAPADLVGQNPWSIAVEGEPQRWERHFPLRGASPLVSFVGRVRHKDGHPIVIRVRAQVITGEGGRRLGGIGEWIVLASDAEESAEQARGLDHVPMLLHYDADHILTAVEPHQVFLGWDPDEVIGTPFSLAGLDLATTRSVMDGLVRVGPEHALGPTPVQRADGTAVVVGIRLRLVLEDGVLTRYTGEVHVLD